MKKIDLHLHTKQSITDSDFSFSLSSLIKYVTDKEIDCIAVTNHNLFDLSQFKEIQKALSIQVFPGIEIDLEKGHLLLISPNFNLEDFKLKCDKVQKEIDTPNKSLSIETFMNIFEDLNNYLLIPHYQKYPIINEYTLNQLKEYIHCGEVKNQKNFHICIKNTDMLVPVLFSDERISEDMNFSTMRQTYIDSEELKFNDIKHCLSDKNKVFLSKVDGHSLFQILDNGFSASTGLNIVLGERSSGKTFTLNQISKNFKNVKYIKQFSLVERNEDDEDKAFKNRIKTSKSLLTENYLKEFKEVLDDINKINLNNELGHLENYISTLKSFAEQNEKLDSYSKAYIYSEDIFQIKDLNSIETIIRSIILLLDTLEYKHIIEKYVEEKKLRELLSELILHFRELKLINIKKEYINSIIFSAKDKLILKTEIMPPSQCDFESTFIKSRKVQKFENIVIGLKNSKEIYREDLHGFKVIANVSELSNATDVQAQYGKKVSFYEIYKSYMHPYEYLTKLKEMQSIPESEFYKLFIKINYEILNQFGFNVSGGERSEFNLLNELSNSLSFDMLLIDEPESSFDNIFLNMNVNKMIKELSAKIPIFVITHNNNIGKSIKPDYLIFTKRFIDHGTVTYKVFGGFPTNTKLKSIDGDEIDNYSMLMDCLEGGTRTYNERKHDYEILRNPRK